MSADVWQVTLLLMGRMHVESFLSLLQNAALLKPGLSDTSRLRRAALDRHPGVCGCLFAVLRFPSEACCIDW